ncbi:capsular polysaccharide biosynthesis protein [Spirochaetia bacterium]|nr:capsular polysaccharide biosynthesis protein [Spirochaetia bacterium]GHU29922.1 capsular polysaccharide biosynthesis protein [Spirochaetia bacterium]
MQVELIPPEVLVQERPLPEPEPITVPDFLTLVAVGDNLIHDSVYESAFSEGEYRFIPFYEKVKEYIEPADIAFINQETILGGARFGFSGYPRFNTPQEMAVALVETGFDIVNHATNHSMDKGEAGIIATMDLWDSIPEIQYIGVRRELDVPPAVIIEKNSIRVGFLAYTYGTNGLPVPASKPYLVSRIDTDSMAGEIDSLRPLCDVVVVSMHWGEEYQHNYNARQKSLAAFLAEHSVDIVLGHHPHVLQPVENIPRPDGGTMLCFYSLGNFLSAQSRPSTLLGGIAYIKLKKFEDHITIEESGVVPVLTHYNRNFQNFRVYPLDIYNDEATHRVILNAAVSISYFDALAETVLGNARLKYNPFRKDVF